jgi:peptidyl-prolyl cis-trans isomerase D
MRAPRIYGAVLAGQSLETRDGRWFNVTQAMAGQAGTPTEAQLTAFLNENADRLRRPEFRMVSLVLFSPASGAAPAVSEEQIRERFEFRKASLSQPETRTFTTFTTADQQAAGRIAAALRAGQDPAEVGRANRVEPVQYEARPQSAVTDRAVGSAVFGLTAGQVSQPIRGQLGWTVARLGAIQPGQPATLESARAEIVQELQAEAVRGQTFERVEAYEKARNEGADLNTAVTRVGARVIQLPPFTAEGALPDGQPMQAPPQIIASAYSLAKGGESDVIDAGQGQYFVVRLDDIRPAAMPTLAEVREPLTAAWTQRENGRLLNAKAEQLAARVRGGEDIAAVARSAGAEVVVRTGVQQNEETQQSIGQGAFRGLFGQGRGQVFTGPTGPSSIAIGRVDAIHAANPTQAAPLVEQIRPRLTQQMVQEMVESAAAAGAEASNARNDPARARAALGLQPETAPAPGAPAPAKK